MGTTSKSKLKEAFNALCVPNQGDFELLINFCDEGNQILSASQAGLIIKDNRLAVNPNQDIGLGFSYNALVLKLKTALCADSAVRVLLSPQSGLSFKQQGMAINNGDGLELLSNVLQLKLTQKSGLVSDTHGLRVALDGAVLKEVDFSDLIDLADDSRIKLGLTSDFPEPLPGLENTSKQLALKVGDGLEINPQNNQVQVKIKPNAGIEATADGLVLKTDPNGGLNLDQAGLLINYGDGLKLDGYAGESKLSIDANTGLIVNASGIQVNLAADSGLELGDHGLK
ncbi:hypothetical protein BGZ97_012471, partial [Linnemannia gamsii]